MDIMGAFLFKETSVVRTNPELSWERHRSVLLYKAILVTNEQKAWSWVLKTRDNLTYDHVTVITECFATA